MPWGRMDDKFHRNRKVRALRKERLGREALGAWVFWWSWCLDDPELTGVVPFDELQPHDWKVAPELVSAGLWEEIEGGFRFHDFEQYNPTAEKVAKKRTADRERAAQRRAAESRANPSRVASDTDATSERLASDSGPSPSGIAFESPPRARAGTGREGLGSLPSESEGTEDRSLFQDRASRYELWDRAYQVQYARLRGAPCAKTTKYAEHIRALVEWSLAGELTEAQCRAVVVAFFADRTPEIVEANHWIGWLVPRAAEYLSGPRKPKLTSAGEIAAARSEAVLAAERRELADMQRTGEHLGMQDMAALARSAIADLKGKVAT